VKTLKETIKEMEAIDLVIDRVLIKQVLDEETNTEIQFVPREFLKTCCSKGIEKGNMKIQFKKETQK